MSRIVINNDSSKSDAEILRVIAKIPPSALDFADLKRGVVVSAHEYGLYVLVKGNDTGVSYTFMDRQGSEQ